VCISLSATFTDFNSRFIMLFNTPSACGGVIPLNTGPGLALGFNTLYFVNGACSDQFLTRLKAKMGSGLDLGGM